MLGFPKDAGGDRKCYVTHGTYGHIDPKQPPMKRKPFAAILGHDFLHKAELILPEELFYTIKAELFNVAARPTFRKVILPLSALLEGEFFNEYIKKGNVLMLSEGRRGIDNIYALKDGILTLHLDKETYERAGIVGKPDGVKGKRGTRPRWLVQINLREPSMLHGKKGFDRIVYACKNVLSASVTWLFCDLVAQAPSPDPLDKHFPIAVTVSPEEITGIKVNLPPLQPPGDAEISEYSDDFDDFAIETQEWLSLISLSSPRIDADDRIDPFLSRYVSPGESTATSTLVRVTWRGFFSPQWAHQMLVQAMLTIPKKAWFVFSVGGFVESWSGGNKGCTILRVPDASNEYLLWEIAE